MGVTIRDLAEHCGLSVSAVSKALNGYSDISETTRQTVMAAVRELDYHPNAHARALKGGRSYNLGVLFSDDSQSGLTHPFFSVVLEHFKREAEQEGYDITFIGHRMGNGRVTYLDHCRYREVDGVCMACLDFDDAEVQEVTESELPVVTIDRRFQGVPSVLSDNEGGMRALMDYVYSLGHRRVAYVHGPSSAVSDARLTAFQESAARLGLTVPPEYLLPCRYTDPENARAIVRVLLSLPQRPTCILMCDDYNTTGAKQAAVESGVNIPGDVSLAGFDGLSQMQSFSPRLTTVYQDAPRMGREAARLLIAQIENRPFLESIIVPVRLLRGETVVPVSLESKTI